MSNPSRPAWVGGPSHFHVSLPPHKSSSSLSTPFRQLPGNPESQQFSTPSTCQESRPSLKQSAVRPLSMHMHNMAIFEARMLLSLQERSCRSLPTSLASCICAENLPRAKRSAGILAHRRTSRNKALQRHWARRCKSRYLCPLRTSLAASPGRKMVRLHASAQS